MKRSEQKEKRRQEILNAGLDLFIRKGYAATRTSDIAAAVGMSEGLLFHYFATKEALYSALIDVALTGRENSFATDAAEPLIFFEAVAKYIVENCARDSLTAKLFVLMKYAENDSALSEEVRENIKGQRELEQTVKIIEKGQRDGSIKNGDPLALASAFWACMQGVVENVALRPELPVPNYRWIVDIVRNF